MQIILGLGANLGQREETIANAITLIEELIGPVIKRSSWHKTPALLHPSNPAPQPSYINAVIICDTKLKPESLLETIHKIEAKLGRRRSPDIKPWSARSIDIDIIAIENKVYDSPNIQIPHARMHERDFVLKPLVEVAPDWIHPILKLTAQELLNELNRKLP